MAERFLGGRVARVTGGASGQGRACALALAEAGAGVAVGSYPATRRPKPELEDTYYPAAGELDRVAAHRMLGRGAGGVDQDVDLAQFGDRGVVERRHRFGRAHVEVAASG